MADLDLIERAQHGDTKALADLYREHAPAVLAYLGWRVDPATAEDIAAEVWVRVLRKLPSYTPDPRGLGPWLVTIARNLVVDHFKSSRVRLEWTHDEIADGDEHAAAADDVIAEAETARELRALLDRLTGAQAQAMRLRYLDELSIEDTAARMGIDPGAVKALTFRGVRALRAIPHQHLRGEIGA